MNTTQTKMMEEKGFCYAESKEEACKIASIMIMNCKGTTYDISVNEDSVTYTVKQS